MLAFCLYGHLINKVYEGGENFNPYLFLFSRMTHLWRQYCNIVEYDSRMMEYGKNDYATEQVRLRDIE